MTRAQFAIAWMRGHVYAGLVLSLTMLFAPEGVAYRYQIGLGALGIAFLSLVFWMVLEGHERKRGR